MIRAHGDEPFLIRIKKRFCVVFDEARDRGSRLVQQVNTSRLFFTTLQVGRPPAGTSHPATSLLRFHQDEYSGRDDGAVPQLPAIAAPVPEQAGTICVEAMDEQLFFASTSGFPPHRTRRRDGHCGGARTGMEEGSERGAAYVPLFSRETISGNCISFFVSNLLHSR